MMYNMMYNMTIRRYINICHAWLYFLDRKANKPCVGGFAKCQRCKLRKHLRFLIRFSFVFICAKLQLLAKVVGIFIFKGRVVPLSLLVFAISLRILVSLQFLWQRHYDEVRLSHVMQSLLKSPILEIAKNLILFFRYMGTWPMSW